MIGDGSILIESSVWHEDTIVTDVWSEGPASVDPEGKADQITDYYLLQMNFIGNIL